MKVIIRDNAREGGLWAAHYIARKIKEKAAVTDAPFAVIVFQRQLPFSGRVITNCLKCVCSRVAG